MIAYNVILLLISTYFHVSLECELLGADVEPGDRFGYSVSISGDTLVVGAPRADSNSTIVNGDSWNNDLPDSGAAYVFRNTEDGWIQEAYLKAPNAGEQDQFGYSVDIDGDTIVVGATDEDSLSTDVDGDQYDDAGSNYDSGAAYVFVRNADGNWTFDTYLKPSSTYVSGWFGYSVKISLNTIVVGAPGEENPLGGGAYVFVKDGTTWTPQGHLKAINAVYASSCGSSVSISEETIALGCQSLDEVTIFERSGNSWNVKETITRPAAEAFGYGVSLSGDTLAVGGFFGLAEVMSVFLYVRNAGGTWDYQTTLNKTAGFGYFLSLSDNTLLAGASGENSGGSGWNGCDFDAVIPGSGTAYIFEGPDWDETVCIKSPSPIPSGTFGGAVAQYEGTFLVGQARQDVSNGAFVFPSATCLPPPVSTTTGTTATTGTTGTTGTTATATTGSTTTTETVTSTDSTGTTGSSEGNT